MSLLFLTSINESHLSRRYAKTFWPIPGLISCEKKTTKKQTLCKDVLANTRPHQLRIFHERIYHWCDKQWSTSPDPWKKGRPRCYTKSPTVQDMFSQYQASSATLGWPGDGDCYLMYKMQSCGWPNIHMTSRSFLNVLQLSLGNRCYDTSSHNRHMLWISIHMSGYSEALEVPEILVAIAWTRYGVSNEACGHKTQAHVCIHMPQKTRLPFFLESMLIDTHTYAPMYILS